MSDDPSYLIAQKTGDVAGRLALLDQAADSNIAIPDTPADGIDAAKIKFVANGASSVARTVADKLQDVCSIKDFMIGVPCDDDTTAVKAALNQMGQTGGIIALPADRDLLISSPIDVMVTGTIPYAPRNGSASIHFMQTNSVAMMGMAGKAIRCAPNFSGAYMIRFIFNQTLGEVGPFWSIVSDLRLDGEGLADTAIVSNYTMNVSLIRNRIKGVQTGVQWIGYGVTDVQRNTLMTDICFDLTQGGGDSWIHKNDLYPFVTGLQVGSLGGDLRAFHNVFTRQDVDVSSSCAPTGIAANDPTNNLRDFLIQGNEFSGMAIAVNVVGGTSGNCYGINISDNHLIPSAGGAMWTGKLAALVNVSDFLIKGNRIGASGLRAPQPPLTDAAISISGGQDGVVSANNFANLWRPAIVAGSFKGLVFGDNTIADVAQEGVGSTAIYLNSVSQSSICGNVARRTISTAGQTFISETGSSTDNRGAGNATSGFATYASLAAGSTSNYGSS